MYVAICDDDLLIHDNKYIQIRRVFVRILLC